MKVRLMDRNSLSGDECEQSMIVVNAVEEFVTETIVPRFKLWVKKMSTVNRVTRTEMIHRALMVVVDSIKEKLDELNVSDVQFQRRTFRYAGSVLFTPEVCLEFSKLLEGALKFCYVIWESNEWIESHEKITAGVVNKLNQTSFITDVLFGEEFMSLGSSLIASSFVPACADILNELTRRTCTASPRRNVLKIMESNLKKLSEWSDLLHLHKAFTENYAFLKSCMEKSLIFHLIKQIYDIVIVEYPDSADVVDDLRTAMLNQNGYGRTEIVNILLEGIHKRLLHVGIGTTDILQGYANSVECLRRLDPTCVIMHRVCSVIRAYIKQRPDTVRCIITYITGPKRQELGEQLTQRKNVIVDEEELSGINDELVPGTDDNEEIMWWKWEPDPPDAEPGQSRRFRQNADVFNMLVSVYGSKELFVKEYRQLLAERLTKSWNRDPNFEHRYLELLKLRFSEGELQQCDVMLKDMRDSERIDRFVSKSLPFPISARIISSFFWPKIDDEKFKPPAALQAGLDAYRCAFESYKASRTLEWLTGVGCIEMDIECDGAAVSVVVPSTHAVVIMLFLQKESWSVDDITSELGMDKRNVRKYLDWWRNSGLLSIAQSDGSGSDVWQLVTTGLRLDRLRAEPEADEESSDDESGEDTAAVDALEQYWTYTRSFMASQEPIKPERLHTIFKMFSSPGQQGPSLDTVIAFLQRKVKLNLLSCTNGLYKVVKDSAPR
ncbi:hypothetical protein AB6A40_000674 [Gnathostoma spinigerum]|uniref:Anaphase-promoting complex subunit 2 n=1 Tax=Gnathostoma spinigerum TaxID=75299 RepID=A0ABD6ECD4_9BILA